MRYTQAEKMDIIRLVEESDLPVKRTLVELDVPRSTFYQWHERYRTAGYEGLADQQPGPRQLAWHITDMEGYFISETSVYRILKSYDLITSPVFDIVKASDRFKDPTKRVNEMWQTDFTQFKVIGWGWYYLCNVLDDFSRYIIAWRLAPSMAATDVQDTLQSALDIAGSSMSRSSTSHDCCPLTDPPSSPMPWLTF